MQALGTRHPERRLLAFSEEADDFWASLGWTRYDHPEGPRSYRLLFMQPVAGSLTGSAGMAPVFDGAAQRVFFVARLRGGVNSSAIAAIADGTIR
jgi:hypothetical protein